MASFESMYSNKFKYRVNYLQDFHEDPFLIIRIGILCFIFVVLVVGVSRYSCTETHAEGNGNSYTFNSDT